MNQNHRSHLSNTSPQVFQAASEDRVRTSTKQCIFCYRKYSRDRHFQNQFSNSLRRRNRERLNNFQFLFGLMKLFNLASKKERMINVFQHSLLSFRLIQLFNPRLFFRLCEKVFSFNGRIVFFAGLKSFSHACGSDGKRSHQIFPMYFQ